MTPIAELAKYKLRDVPEFAALMLPPTNVTTQSAVAAAYAMADAASAHAQTFIDNGLAATFVDDIRTAAAAVSASIVDRGKQQGRRTGATAGLAAGEKRGRAFLRVLSALVVAHIANDAALMAEWMAARVVRRKPGPAAGSQPSVPAPIHLEPMTVTPTPAPTPVTPAVGVAA
jgi:hypothetical protein